MRNLPRPAIYAAAAVSAWVVLQLALARPTPLGIVALGVVLGGLNAMLAIGIILIYRSSRIVNFAHGELGAFAGVLTAQLIASGWNYFAAAGAGLATAMVTTAVIELVVIRRFRTAPRLILTVVTIVIAQLLVFVQLMIPRLFDRPVLSASFRTPLTRFRFEVAPVVFDGNHVLIIMAAAGVLVGLAAFFRGRFGIGVRAIAENAERAALCGIPTSTLSTLVWVMAGGLSAAAAILQSPVVGLQVGVLIGPGLLLRALAAAVLARMESLPIAVAASLGLAIFEQALFWSYGRSTVIDATLLVVILAALLVQRARFSRVDASEPTWQAVAAVRPVPEELRQLPEVAWARRLLVLGGMAAIVVIPSLLSVSRQNLASVVVIFALIGVSLVVLTGWAGQISLGQFALVGIGAAVSGRLTANLGWDFVPALLAGSAAGLVAALVLGLPALRIRGFFLAVTTLAFAVTTSTFLLQQRWLVPTEEVRRPVLFGQIDLENELSYYYLCLVTLLVVLASLRGLRQSRVGRAIVGTRDNERASQSYGINAVAAKLYAFGISGFIAGLAGALLAHQQHGLPATQYAPQQSLAVFAVAVIGGLGSMPGAVLGAVYFKGSQYLLQGPWQFFATGAGQLVLLLVFPAGLGALLFSARDSFLRRVAARRGIIAASLLADRRRETPPTEESPGPSPLGRPVPVGAKEVV